MKFYPPCCAFLHDVADPFTKCLRQNIILFSIKRKNYPLRIAFSHEKDQIDIHVEVAFIKGQRHVGYTPPHFQKPTLPLLPSPVAFLIRLSIRGSTRRPYGEGLVSSLVRSFCLRGLVILLPLPLVILDERPVKPDDSSSLSWASTLWWTLNQ